MATEKEVLAWLQQEWRRVSPKERDALAVLLVEHGQSERRKGREEMRERVAKAASESDCPGPLTTAAMIRALPLDDPGER